MSTLDSGRYNNLKARVKAECLRRAFTGSVSSYGGSAYDYTDVPAAGKVVKLEHKAKIATPLSAINKNTIPASMAAAPQISDSEMTKMEAFTTVCEKRSKTDSSGSDCAASCTGLCYGCTGTCVGTCSGCSNTCSGTCTGGCNGCSGCGSGCAGCSGCGSGCIGGCSGGCGSGCTGGCYGSCSGCSGNCTGGCDTSVFGCSTMCTGGCEGGCGGTCEIGCSGGCGSGCSGGCVGSK